MDALFVTDKRGRHMIRKLKTIAISAASPFASRLHLRLWRLLRLGMGLLSSVGSILFSAKSGYRPGGYPAVPPVMATSGLACR